MKVAERESMLVDHESRISIVENGVNLISHEIKQLTGDLRKHMDKEESDRKELSKKLEDDRKDIEKKINIAILILVAIAASQGVDLSGIL